MHIKINVEDILSDFSLYQNKSNRDLVSHESIECIFLLQSRLSLLCEVRASLRRFDWFNRLSNNVRKKIGQYCIVNQKCLILVMCLVDGELVRRNNFLYF